MRQLQLSGGHCGMGAEIRKEASIIWTCCWAECPHLSYFSYTMVVNIWISQKMIGDNMLKKPGRSIREQDETEIFTVISATSFVYWYNFSDLSRIGKATTTYLKLENFQILRDPNCVPIWRFIRYYVRSCTILFINFKEHVHYSSFTNHYISSMTGVPKALLKVGTCLSSCLNTDKKKRHTNFQHMSDTQSCILPLVNFNCAVMPHWVMECIIQLKMVEKRCSCFIWHRQHSLVNKNASDPGGNAKPC